MLALGENFVLYSFQQMFVVSLNYRVANYGDDDAMCQTREGSRSGIVWMIERDIFWPSAKYPQSRISFNSWMESELVCSTPGAAQLRSWERWKNKHQKCHRKFLQTTKNPINILSASSFFPRRMCWAVQILPAHVVLIPASFLFEVNVKLNHHVLDVFIDLLNEVFRFFVQRFNDQFGAFWLNYFLFAIISIERKCHREVVEAENENFVQLSKTLMTFQDLK